jgi:hypothetical protein
MKYAVEMITGAVIYLPSFTTQNLKGGDTQTHRHYGDRISLHSFFSKLGK